MVPRILKYIHEEQEAIRDHMVVGAFNTQELYIGAVRAYAELEKMKQKIDEFARDEESDVE